MSFAVLKRVAALTALLLLPTGAAGAPAPGPATLLARHAPVVVLHPLEQLMPVPVDGFLADSDIEQKTADGTWAVVPGLLPTSGGPWRLNQRLCAAKGGITALDCYATAEAAHGATPTTYGAFFRRGDRIALQYWLFYPFNPYSPTVPQTPEYAQVHEGDWELVTVILDRTGKPLAAGYSRHCSGARRPWEKVERRGQRPVVYVALGSHANYFTPGTFLHEKRCWPPEAVAVFEQNGKPLKDYAARGRVASLRVARVTVSTPQWMRFPGAWGEDQYVVFPQVAFKSGLGPTGPAFKKVWRDPVGVPLTWPKG